MNNISIPSKYYNSLLLYVISLKDMSGEIDSNVLFKDQLNKIHETACDCYELLEHLSKQVNIFQDLNSLQFEIDKIKEKYEKEQQEKISIDISDILEDLNKINLQIVPLKESITEYFE